MQPFPCKGQLTIYKCDIAGRMTRPTAGTIQSLTDNRFQHLPEGQEGSSCGWVGRDGSDQPPSSIDDLLTSYPAEGEELVQNGLWVRMRIDARKVPKHLVDMAVENAEKSRGRRVSKKERAEIRSAVAESVLPRLPTTTKLVHVAVCGDLVFLTSCTAAVRDAFTSLWLATFPNQPLTCQKTTGLEDDAPHPVLWDLLACNQLRNWSRGVPMPLEAVFDGNAVVQNKDGERVTISGETAAVETEVFAEALRNGGELRAASFIAFYNAAQGATWNVRADAVSGALAIGFEDGAEDEPAEERSNVRIGIVNQFATRWLARVQESYGEDAKRRGKECRELFVDVDDGGENPTAPGA